MTLLVMVVLFVVLLTPGNSGAVGARTSTEVGQEGDAVSWRELLGAYLSVILPER